MSETTVTPEPAPEAPADPPETLKGLKRLMWSVIPANIGLYMIWGAVPGILLPQQITLAFGSADNANAANLAVVATIGAFAAMVSQPIAGELSDRTRSRFGRRAPWIVFGSTAGALALIGLSFAHTLLGFVLAWVAVQAAFNFAQGPFAAILPDRVPLSRRGTFASLKSLGMFAGILGGQILGSVFFEDIRLGYFVFAGFAVAVLFLFVVANPDHSSLDMKQKPFKVKEFLGVFWVNPKRYPDFAWAFLGRLLLYAGYSTVITYKLYLLQNYFDVEQPQRVIPILGLLSVAGLVSSALLAGPLSDKVGRRKPFVVASAALVALSMIIPWVLPTIGAWMVTTFIMGLGFGTYQAVGTALISEVLPSQRSHAKDLGIVNIAATLPQAMAPALAGLIVLTLGYSGLFPVGIVLGLLGAAAILPIRSVK